MGDSVIFPRFCVSFTEEIHSRTILRLHPAKIDFENVPECHPMAIVFAVSVSRLRMRRRALSLPVAVSKNSLSINSSQCRGFFMDSSGSVHLKFASYSVRASVANVWSIEQADGTHMISRSKELSIRGDISTTVDYISVDCLNLKTL
jgi:hypothetical protein